MTWQGRVSSRRTAQDMCMFCMREDRLHGNSYGIVQTFVIVSKSDYPHTCCKSCRYIDQTFKISGYSKSGLLLIINVSNKLQMNAARGGNSIAECSLRKMLVYLSAKHFEKKPHVCQLSKKKR